MSKIFVTGGSGLVGSALRDVGLDATYLSSKDCDLRDPVQVQTLFMDERPDAIIHLAGKVGGVKANMEQPAQFFEDNIMMNHNVLKYAREAGVERLVATLSTCIFPDDTSYPLKEEYLHDGAPHGTNFAYAHAKRMVEIQARAYREQYGLNYTCLVPTNIYGPHDNFHPNDSHVIPGLIQRAHECNENGEEFVIWGSGEPQRDFIFSHDLAKLVIKVLEEYDSPSPINLATGIDVSINHISELIVSHYPNIKGISHDLSKPEGQFKKSVDISKLLEFVGEDFNFTSLKEGVNFTVKWYNDNYPNVRGI